MRTVYWLSVAIVAYVFVGYPLLLAAWAALRGKRDDRRPAPRLGSAGDLRSEQGLPAAGSLRSEQALPAAGSLRSEQGFSPARLPSISIILAARDEAPRLRGRLDNLLALDYPGERPQVIVVSDGSRDDTPAVLAEYRGRVTAILLASPVGKAAALNAGAAAAAGEILVFADARQRFAPDALVELVLPFADPGVGGVSGELLIDADTDTDVHAGDGPAEGSAVGEGVGLYWRYEKWLRQKESDVWSTLGATGAIYALRRALWRPLPPDTLLDDVLAPMRAVLLGYRVVFAPAARAYDRSSADADTELRRKVRTLAGNYQLLRIEPRLALPIVNPVWLQFVSHKLGRLLAPYALASLLVSNVPLASSSIFFGLTLTLQVAFYVLAAHGATVALGPAAATHPASGGRRPAAATRAALGDGEETKKGADKCAA